ncbi:MAG TPA: signal recognition particle protein, partial [Lapillicoccus sp.]|nr:signal recognition particle protein [Lapillicoccus sp.]
SRRARIARGSGVTVSEVNQLLERFREAQKMMKSLARGGGAGLPGMPGVPGAGRKGGRGAPAQRRKSKSGNPAKRAAEERAAAERSAAARSAAAGSAFGLPSGSDGDGASQLDPANLPAGFEKFLGGR